MTRYLLTRLGQALVIVILVTLITFVILHLLPGGAARAILGKEATLEQIAAFNHEMGYDRPLWQQYAMYLQRLVQGDLGYSFQLNQSVAEAIWQRLPKTMLLSLASTFLAVVVAVPLGVVQAVRRNRWPDYTINGLSLLAYATPIFFMGLMMIILFSQVWPVLPPEAPQGFTLAEVLADPAGLVLPTLTLTILTVAVYSRYVRSSMVDNLNENYVRTARSKGLSEGRVIVGHTLRNGLFPVITLLGMYLPALFSGALVVERLFNYPGMGLLFWQAALKRDYPILLGVTLLISVATVLGALVADVLYAAVDPRVRLKAGRS
ncbi:Oligopeptide transport system permease protein OppB (TC 3.A.1.5.1) [[Actinomadura] parvosata subsp. kistnae]|uniref:Diguanylate cyclase n=1 Tax=[Actinomadura] parvosata subsp. kistnae TaxID=1909395 RepID=A0A1V0AH94_9ACTN|nr:ABC transporter permease [Nonomuraea sp. ATCC 55076]AQZ69580.1 diguanylate cyclase [Nonomuraea sp. ATCC 55076]SPL91735.1 Oligopeptide transport system permease protein OppB (TC 3.A.1.5.1) [Actinomadura parvosata subsp. kistnae]